MEIDAKESEVTQEKLESETQDTKGILQTELHRKYYNKNSNSVLKDRQDDRFSELLSNRESPVLPSIFFYSPPVHESEDENDEQSFKIFQEPEDAYIDISERADSFSPIPPIPPAPPKKKYEEFGGTLFEQYYTENEEQIAFKPDERIKAFEMAVIVNNCDIRSDTSPIAKAGYENPLIVTDYLWEHITINSKLNSILSLELDTTDRCHKENHASVKVKHVVELTSNGQLKNKVTRDIFSCTLSEPGLAFRRNNMLAGTEITTSLRVLHAPADLEVREYVEIEADTDAWVRVDGNFTFDSLKAWWVGLSFGEAISKLDRDKIREILTIKP